MNREPISVALFSTLQSCYSWSTASRKGQIWSSGAPQPAMYLIAWAESDHQDDMALTKYTLKYMCLVYFQIDTDPSSPCAETQMNVILAAIEAVLGIPGGERNNLGISNVINAWIDGELMKDTGILDSQCAIVIPISVLCGI